MIEEHNYNLMPDGDDEGTGDDGLTGGQLPITDPDEQA